MFPGPGSEQKSAYERRVAYAPLPTFATAGGGGSFQGVVTTSSGTLVANEWKTIVSVSGAGLFSAAGVQFSGTDTSTLSCRVKIDGLTVGEGSVLCSTNTATFGINFQFTTTNVYTTTGFLLPFFSSLTIEVARTSTTAMTVGYSYMVSQ